MLRELGVFESAGIREEDLPHAFFALLGAGSFIFSVPANCKRLTGVDPRKRDAIEAHAAFVANLLVPTTRGRRVTAAP